MGMGSANERRRYNVTPTLIGRAHIQNNPFMAWICNHISWCSMGCDYLSIKYHTLLEVVWTHTDTVHVCYNVTLQWNIHHEYA